MRWFSLDQRSVLTQPNTRCPDLNNFVDAYLGIVVQIAGALQVVSGDGVTGLALGVIGELCRVDRQVEGTAQEVVQTAMSAVVWSGTNTEKIYRRRKDIKFYSILGSHIQRPIIELSEQTTPRGKSMNILCWLLTC